MFKCIVIYSHYNYLCLHLRSLYCSYIRCYGPKERTFPPRHHLILIHNVICKTRATWSGSPAELMMSLLCEVNTLVQGNKSNGTNTRCDDWSTGVTVSTKPYFTHTLMHEPRVSVHRFYLQPNLHPSDTQLCMHVCVFYSVASNFLLSCFSLNTIRILSLQVFWHIAWCMRLIYKCNNGNLCLIGFWNLL